ncbi:MAG: diadenylate cyclase CdaA [Erysipelotrichaceae bacterium]|nr:diadenylate cyclase CdaA [Erysipelotrichaceae bacterium]
MDIAVTAETIVRYVRMVIDILIIWVIINYIIKAARGSQRTVQIFQGVILILLVRGLAEYFGLTTVAWLMNNIVSWGFLAIIVIFQPEIRSILERLGKSNALARISVLSSGEKERLIEELVAATANLSASKTGALITLEQGHSLNDYIKTGVSMNSLVSAELLCSIFVKSAPLHDGAVIIQGDKLACASAYFPPTTMDLPSRYGARHRAAIGISEVTDAVTIVISEETGKVAVTMGGKIIQMNEQKLRDFLEKVILNKETVRASRSTVTKSASVTVDSLMLNTDISAPELDFVTPGTHDQKQMKTFQSTDFKAELEEAQQKEPEASEGFGILHRHKSSGNGIVRKVVNDIARERQESSELSKTSKIPIKIRTVTPAKTETEEDKNAEGGNE